MKLVIILVALVFAGSAMAGEREGKGWQQGPKATSTAVGVGTGLGVGKGGAGGGGGSVGDVNATGGSSDETYAYGVGFGLTTSQGECPLLGSMNFLVFATTFEIERCAGWRDIELMGKIGMLAAAQPQPFQAPAWSRACQIPSIADVHPWCVGKVIQR